MLTFAKVAAICLAALTPLSPLRVVAFMFGQRLALDIQNPSRLKDGEHVIFESRIILIL